MARMVDSNYDHPLSCTRFAGRISDVQDTGQSRFQYLSVIQTILTVQIPFMAWLGAFSKIFYDRELAVLERSVKPADVLHNASLILGKQTIHILPEGYSMSS